MNRYPLWLLLGVASGFLWGCNNYLYAAGVYEATEGLLPIGILFPLVCTAINDVSAAVFLLTLNGVRGVLRSGHTVIARRSSAVLWDSFPIASVFCGRDRRTHWHFRHSIPLLAVFWHVFSCISG